MISNFTSTNYRKSSRYILKYNFYRVWTFLISIKIDMRLAKLFNEYLHDLEFGVKMSLFCQFLKSRTSYGRLNYTFRNTKPCHFIKYKTLLRKSPGYVLKPCLQKTLLMRQLLMRHDTKFQSCIFSKCIIADK